MLLIHFKNENVKRFLFFTRKALEPFTLQHSHTALGFASTQENIAEKSNLSLFGENRKLSVVTHRRVEEGGGMGVAKCGKAELGCYLELTPSQSQGRGRGELCVSVTVQK